MWSTSSQGLGHSQDDGCESWTVQKAGRFRTVVLEKTPESPLYSKEIKPVNLKGSQP